MDMAAWLRELGLGRYEPPFRENEIDCEVLPESTEAYLPGNGKSRLARSVVERLSGEPCPHRSFTRQSPSSNARPGSGAR
jgi:hypothetical protein